MSGLFNKIQWGDGLTVTDEGSGVIRVDTGSGGTASSGAGIQFNSGTYGADNVGDYTTIETSATNPDGWGVTFVNEFGLFLRGTDGQLGNGALRIEQTASAGSAGFETVNVIADDGGFGRSQVYAIEADVGVSGSGGNGIGIGVLASADAGSGFLSAGTKKLGGTHLMALQGIATVETGGTADACAVYGQAGNTGGGREVAGLFQTNGNKVGANSIAIEARNTGGTAIFQVRNDGSIHGLASIGAITWDLA